jgi:hypothetical protein
MASAAPSRPLDAPRARPGWAARAALTAPGVGFALAAAVLAVGTAGFHDPDTGCGDVAGQAGAVAAGPLDPGQAYGPEPAQPAQEAGVSGRGGRELLDSQQPPDGAGRGSGVHVCVGVHAAGDGACLYDGQGHPFLRLRDGTHPLAAGSVNPGLFPGRADQAGAAGGCQKTWDPAGRSFRRTTRAASAESEVRPGPRPLTLRPHQAKTREARPEADKQGQKHYPHPPCRV